MKKKIWAIGIIALLVLGVGVVATIASSESAVRNAENETNLSERLQYSINPNKTVVLQNHTLNARDHIHTLNLSNIGKVEPLAYELKVGDLYFDESWDTLAIASLGDYILTGVPEEGRWVKLWVRYKFSDTDWWACGDVHFEFTDDGGTVPKVCPDGFWTGDSDEGTLSPPAFLVYPGHVYDYHGKVYRGEESDESSGRLYVYS